MRRPELGGHVEIRPSVKAIDWCAMFKAKSDQTPRNPRPGRVPTYPDERMLEALSVIIPGPDRARTFSQIHRLMPFKASTTTVFNALRRFVHQKKAVREGDTYYLVSRSPTDPAVMELG